MRLTSTLQTLEAVMSGAANSTNPTYDVSYIDVYHESGQPPRTIPGSKTGSLNGVTEVTICEAPGPDFVERQITSAVIYNADDASVIITVSKEVDTTEYDIMKVTLAAGYALSYEGGTGRWQVSPAETSDSDSKATSNSVVISTNLSTGTSRATSNSVVISTNLAAETSRSTSQGLLVSGNTSRATSNSLLISTNLSAATSVATLASQNTSAATSNSTVISTNLAAETSRSTSQGLLISANASAILSAHP